MRSQAFRHVLLAFVVLSTVLWLDLITPETLGRLALYGLAWATASTLLVASAGAVVALARMRRAHRQ